jgi:hypothetical protein
VQVIANKAVLKANLMANNSLRFFADFCSGTAKREPNVEQQEFFDATDL